MGDGIRDDVIHGAMQWTLLEIPNPVGHCAICIPGKSNKLLIDFFAQVAGISG